MQNMMMYITEFNPYRYNEVGIRKKVMAQINTFSKVFGKVLYTIWAGGCSYLMCDNKVVEKKLSLSKQSHYDSVAMWVKEYRIDRAYIRFQSEANPWFLNMVERLKKEGVRYIVEFPTYPYDKEIMDKLQSCEDKICSRYLKEYVSLATSYVREENVYGISVIRLYNGIEKNSCPLKKQRTQDGRTILIAVSGMSFWQGFERVILGLKDYYDTGGSREVLFYLVGDGNELSTYRSLVKKCSLEDRVKFFGCMTGNALDEMYNQADIAISALGWYKKGLQYGSGIKNREYTLRGIPFVLGYTDDGFGEECKWVYQVDNDDSRLDILKIVNWHDKLMRLNGQYSYEMRAYANACFTWDKILSPVVDYYDYVG